MPGPVRLRRAPASQTADRVVTAPLRGVSRLRRTPPPERAALVGLVALAVAAVLGGELLGPAVVPPSVLVLPLLGGGLLLRAAGMRRLLVVVALCVVVDVALMGVWVVRPGNLVVLALTGVVSYEFARSREDTGLVGSEGDTLLVELRRRLAQQGELPALPPGWSAEARVRPAGDAPFSGDFVASALTGGRYLEVVLVDVSGKGVAAGTRALLLSGALGGLLGAVPPRDFLPAANAYLNRQDWSEGFATAVHLVLDLQDGSYSVESAGHPPAALFDAGSGRWSVLPTQGVALGLLPDLPTDGDTGRLEPGDALLLYTDGMVEVAGRDLAVGIDKLLGEAERLVTQGLHGGADLLLARVGGASDDRGVVLVWREG